MDCEIKGRYYYLYEEDKSHLNGLRFKNVVMISRGTQYNLWYSLVSKFYNYPNYETEPDHYFHNLTGEYRKKKNQRLRAVELDSPDCQYISVNWHGLKTGEYTVDEVRNKGMVCQECEFESLGTYGWEKHGVDNKRNLCNTHKEAGGFCGCGDHYTDCDNCHDEFTEEQIQNFVLLEEREREQERLIELLREREQPVNA
jgi:hypothetical protein